MKFVCENCKAKYQIGDEKVAGKTVRMKCRRCGNMIQINASVTETSVSNPAPARPAPPRAVPKPSPGPGARRVPAPPPPRPRPSVPSVTPLEEEEDATKIMRSPPTDLMKPAAAPAPPRPSATELAASAQALSDLSSRTSTPGLATAFSSAMQSSSSSAEPPADDWYVGVGGVPLGPVRLSVIREKAEQGAVDGESLVWREGYDEWQPLRTFPKLLEIVDEAAARGKSRKSGMYTPAPVAAASAPFNLIREPERASGLPARPRPSTPTPTPKAPAVETPTSGAQASMGRPAAAPRPLEPLAAAPSGASGAATGLSASGHVARSTGAGESTSAELMGAKPAAIDVLADPFRASTAPPADASPGFGAQGPDAPKKTNGVNGSATNGSASLSGHDVGASEAAVGALDTTPKPQVSVQPPVAAPPASISPEAFSPKRKGLHPLAYAFIAMAAVFGGVAAYVLLVKPPEIRIVEKPGVAPEPKLPGVAVPPPPGESTAETEVGDPTTPGQPTAGGVSGTGPIAKAGSNDPKTPSTSTGSSGPDQSSFNSGVGGPSSAPGGGSEGDASSKLTGGEISGVVSRNQSLVRRRCWEPAFQARSSGAPTSAKVTATVQIAPNGSVSNVSASGGSSHYPGLASCVQGQISGWKFPTAGGSSTAVIPFHFLSN